MKPKEFKKMVEILSEKYTIKQKVKTSSGTMIEIEVSSRNPIEVQKNFINFRKDVKT